MNFSFFKKYYKTVDFFYFNNIINIRSSFDYELPISNSVIRLVFYDVTTNITIPNSLLTKL